DFRKAHQAISAKCRGAARFERGSRVSLKRPDTLAEALTFACQAVSARSVTWGRSVFVVDAKLMALSGAHAAAEFAPSAIAGYYQSLTPRRSASATRGAFATFFRTNASRIRSGVKGWWRILAPSGFKASFTATHTEPIAPIRPPSPIPLAPSLVDASGVSTWS